MGRHKAKNPPRPRMHVRGRGNVIRVSRPMVRKIAAQEAWTLRELANVLEVQYHTVYLWMYDKELPVTVERRTGNNTYSVQSPQFIAWLIQTGRFKPRYKDPWFAGSDEKGGV